MTNGKCVASSDYAIHEAEDGQLGLQAIALCRPDVILIDLGLPDLDGLTVLRRLPARGPQNFAVTLTRNCRGSVG